jgi:transcription elongation GreA/GreB family factor
MLSDDGMVMVGSSVRIRDGDVDEEWRIVARHEADALERRKSEECPLARALLGRQVGDRVRVHSPAGYRPVTILRVDDRPPDATSAA